MTHMENIKKQSPYSHLPNFAILSKNKLYLPNLSTSSTILGKWSLDWINSDRYVLGFVEQDDHKNIFYQITSCYEFINGNVLQLIPKTEFTTYWNRVYKHEPLLTLIKFNISDFYSSNGANIIVKKVEDIVKQVTDKPLIVKQVADNEKQVADKPKKIKEKVIDNYEFTVAKTEKPDVYYVYKGINYISACLIYTLKISRYMQDVFEH